MYQPSRGRGRGQPRGAFVQRGRGDSRGGWRGGGRGGYHGAPRVERDILGGLGSKAVDELNKRALRFVGTAASASDTTGAFVPGDEEDATIGEVAFVGSYNWMDAKTPTIIVPGCPRIWSSPTAPYQLQSDITVRGSSPTIIDQNGHRLPSSPLLPLFLAADHASTHSLSDPLNWPDVDFITDRNGLRKLFRWATGSEKARDWRIDLDLVGRMTVVMQRWEASTSVPPAPTFGAGFEQFATKEAEGVTNETGHHRIVSYDFGGLQMVVRFEVDGCLPFTSKERGQALASSIPKPDPEDDIDALTASLASTSLGPKLALQVGGLVPPQTHILELATRSARNPELDTSELIPQLVLSGTPNYIQALHTSGLVERVRVLGAKDVQGQVGSVREGLKRLRRVLEVVQERLVEQGDGARLSLVCRAGKVELFEREEGGALLGADILKRFE